jgi:hypothetical protein
MAFERYLRTRMAKSTQPAASIWKMGQVSLNRSAAEMFKLGGFKYVALFFDRDKKRIGLKFTNDAKEPGVGKISTKRGGAAIYAKGFLQHFGIDFSQSKRYTIQHDEKNGMLILESE